MTWKGCMIFVTTVCLLFSWRNHPVWGQSSYLASAPPQCSTECPPGKRCLLDNVTVPWDHMNGHDYLCSSYKTCYNGSSYVEQTPVTSFFPVRLWPVDIARGSSVYFVSQGFDDILFLFRIYHVQRGNFFNCSKVGGVEVSSGLIRSLKVPQTFFTTLGYKYFIAADNLFVGCHFGFRLHVNVKDATNCTGHSTVPVDGRLCSGKGHCLSSSFTAGMSCECCRGYSGDFCEEYDSCSVSPCQRGNCSDILAGHKDTFVCHCPEGYIGQRCNVDIDDCQPKPCRNGGLCQDGLNSYTCLCPPEIHGKHCELFSNLCEQLKPCKNNGVCIRVGISKQSYICQCAAGFAGQNCTLNATSVSLDSSSIAYITSQPTVLSSLVSGHAVSTTEMLGTSTVLVSYTENVPSPDSSMVTKVTFFSQLSVKSSEVAQPPSTLGSTVTLKSSVGTKSSTGTSQSRAGEVTTTSTPIMTRTLTPSGISTMVTQESFPVTPSVTATMQYSSVKQSVPDMSFTISVIDTVKTSLTSSTIGMVKSSPLPVPPTPEIPITHTISMVTTEVPYSSRQPHQVSPSVTTTMVVRSSTVSPPTTPPPPLINQTCTNQPCGTYGVCTEVANNSESGLKFSCDCLYPTVGPICTTDLQLHFPYFNGRSYIKHKPIAFGSTINQLVISFRTDHDGTILYSGHSSYKDFIKLEVVGKKLKFSIDAGEVVTSVVSSELVTANTTAAVLTYDTRSGTLSLRVNNGPTVSSTTTKSLRAIQLHQPLYIGGIIPRTYTKDRPDVGLITPFVGCIRELEFNDRAILLQDAVDWQNISECDIPACHALPCKSGGVCVSDVQDVSEYSCQCSHPYSGKNCQRKFACLVNICNGGTCFNTTEGIPQCLCPFGKGGVVCDQDIVINVPTFTVANNYSSFLQYITPSGIVDQLDIRLEMKPDNHTRATQSALLFYVGLHDHLSVGSDGDYLALGLQDNHILLQYNLGSGPVQIFSKHPLNPNQEWFVILAGRKGRDGYLYVDNDDMQEASSPAPLVGLNVFGHMYLGGIQDISQLNSEVAFTEGFRGIIKDAKVRTGSSNVWFPLTTKHSSNSSQEVAVVRGVNVQNERVEACVHGACSNNGTCVSLGASFVCKCPPTWSGMLCNDTAIPCREYNPCAGSSTCRMLGYGLKCDCPPGKAGVYCEQDINITTPYFQDHSYMSFSLDKMNVQTKTSMALGFSPNKDDGILFYITRDIKSHSGDFLSITMHDRFLYLIYNLGAGLAKCKSPQPVHINQKNDVVITRDTKAASLEVNGNRTSCQSPGGAVALNVEPTFYLGGVPDLSQVQPRAYENMKDLRDFTGCVTFLTINQQSFDLTESGVVNARNILNCDNTYLADMGA